MGAIWNDIYSEWQYVLLVVPASFLPSYSLSIMEFYILCLILANMAAQGANFLQNDSNVLLVVPVSFLPSYSLSIGEFHKLYLILANMAA